MSVETLPPAQLARLADGARTDLRRLQQRLSSPSAMLLELIHGSVITQSLYVAAQLGVADALRDGPLSAPELAARVQCDADALRRVLRLLASNEVFIEYPDGSFGLTPMAQALRSDVPDSMRGMAVLMGHPIHWEDWSHLIDTVRTGQPCVPALRGMDAFSYLASQPEYGAVFFQGMANMSVVETQPIVEGYDFSAFRTIVDVGGGGGALLAAVLQRATGSRGVLFDARAEVFGARDILAAHGVAERCTIAAGDLFDPVTPGADAYVLKHIIHDWPEEQALTILRNVRDAIAEDGRILLMEFVPEEGNAPHPGRLTDLMLMLLVGGRERTARGYAELLDKAGFELEEVVGTTAAVSVVVGRPKPRLRHRATDTDAAA
ncbi:hydroxyneurosporene methyltransferase [Dactylosporangium aurantiacum]|uniref:Hydroxyneurosporene methyltransferase n=1 Tax=Dactylosporangium aurantiacum TaxID=35754 RepID=A0A9Q9MDX6_9ACTN|nr:methyltransferase [Dactylosporangium aurantiacum]MDG6106625.1 methyltransferase [Dactylosporangium aurantiacum]UWZ50785.1 hydroxyneurosporene methyltransferase [Dactylosporangium aurantiacum]